VCIAVFTLYVRLLARSLCTVVSCLVCIVVVVLCVLLSSYVYLLYYVCIAVFNLYVRLLARSLCTDVSCLVCIVVVVLCVFLSSYMYLLYYVCIAVFTLDVGLLPRSQYSEGPATGHFDTGFSCSPCVYKQMLRSFPTFQVATTCFLCSPPDLYLLATNFMFCIHVK